MKRAHCNHTDNFCDVIFSTRTFIYWQRICTLVSSTKKRCSKKDKHVHCICVGPINKSVRRKCMQCWTLTKYLHQILSVNLIPKIFFQSSNPCRLESTNHHSVSSSRRREVPKRTFQGKKPLSRKWATSNTSSWPYNPPTGVSPKAWITPSS